MAHQAQSARSRSQGPRPPRPRSYSLAPPIIIMIMIYTAGLIVLIVKMVKGEVGLGWIAAIPLMATTTFAINMSIWYYGMMQDQYQHLAWKKALTWCWHYPSRKVRLFLLHVKYGKIRPGIYEPLKPGEIRLLSIGPGGPSDEISCRLRVVNMNGQDVEYDALSCVWGPTHSPRHILLNKSPFTVSPNLFDALRRLRLFDSSRSLWVDALAIDQRNPVERGQQVLLMNEVYSRAREVIVWLGEESPTARSAMRFMSQARTEDDYESWFCHNLKTRFATDSSDWRAVIQLFKNDYWRRVWIVQETAVAACLTIRCGSLSLPWPIANAAQVAWTRFRAQVASIDEQYVLDAIETIPMEEDDVTVVTRAPRDIGPAPLTIIRNDIRAADHNNLIDLLRTTWNSLATDPRDKVFALLSLTRGCQDSGLAANYSLSPWEVYATTIDFMLRNHGNLDLLSYSGLHITYIPTISRAPTWTPTFYWTWEAPTTGAHNRHIFSNSQRDFRASGDRKAMATVNVHHTRLSKMFGLKPGILRASVCRVDRIDKFLFVSNQHLSRYLNRSLWPLQQRLRTCPSSPVTENMREHHPEECKLIDDIRTLYHYFVIDSLDNPSHDGSDKTEPGRSKKSEELWRTLIFNRTPDGITPPDSWSSLFSAVVWGLPQRQSRSLDGSADPNAPDESPLIPYIQPYLRAFRQTIAAKRAVFITSGGRLGLANLTARVGDSVAVVLGCNLPMAVRVRSGIGTGQSTMHGPVYFHGYMRGRAIEEVSTGVLSLETLNFV